MSVGDYIYDSDFNTSDLAIGFVEKLNAKLTIVEISWFDSNTGSWWEPIAYGPDYFGRSIVVLHTELEKVLYGVKSRR